MIVKLNANECLVAGASANVLDLTAGILGAISGVLLEEWLKPKKLHAKIAVVTASSALSYAISCIIESYQTENNP